MPNKSISGRAMVGENQALFQTTVKNVYDMSDPAHPKRLDHILAGLSVLTFTHTKTGTVHQLTGKDGAEYIAFTASADYQEGDSWELNGVPLTAVNFYNGEPLCVGGLITGDTVMGRVADGVLTLFLDRPFNSDDFWTIQDRFCTVEQRRNNPRGKNLGDTFTDQQKSEIAAGTFKGLFLGDYWTIGDRIWRIVDINYWLNDGDTACTTPHLVIMPDGILYSAKMNETNITTGGYVGSQMYTDNLANAKTLVNSAFGSANILTHREYLTNAVTNGYPSAGAWYDSTVELPNEIMMYGSLVFTPAGDGSFVPNRYTIDKTQLALMKLYPRFINPQKQTQWLRDVVSSADFATVANDGNTGYYYASNSLGVRPVFGLVG